MRRSLAVCSLVVTILGGPRFARAQEGDPVADEARARVQRGLELYDDGQLRLALIELERANQLLPSYKIFYNIGQIHFQLGQFARAHAAFTRYLADGGGEIPEERHAEVEADLSTLAKRIATVTVATNPPGTEVTFDDLPAPIGRARVDAGQLRIHATKPGFVAQTRVVTLAGGDELTVRFDLIEIAERPASEGLPPVALGGWIVTGVLAAGAIGTAIATAATSSRFDTMRSAPIAGSAAQARADLDRQGDLVDALALTTDVLIVSTIVAGGVSLWLTLRGRPKSDPPRSGTHSSFTFAF
jgi:hypothetical protein